MFHVFSLVIDTYLRMSRGRAEEGKSCDVNCVRDIEYTGAAVYIREYYTATLVEIASTTS